MKIPKQYKLGGITWKVKESEQLPGCFGATYQVESLVCLLKSLNKGVKGQTFCHELVHTILYSMGKSTDSHDEVFVDGFATFLYQFFEAYDKT